MKPLHNKLNNVPKAEPRSLLCSNNDVNRGSALGFDSQESQTEVFIEQLAELIVRVYLHAGDNSERTK